MALIIAAGIPRTVLAWSTTPGRSIAVDTWSSKRKVRSVLYGTPRTTCVAQGSIQYHERKAIAVAGIAATGRTRNAAVATGGSST